MPRLSRLCTAAALAVALAVPSARAAEPDKYLPAETDTVAFVNVKQLVASDVAKKFILEQVKQFLDGEDTKKILDEMGLDPLKDIDTVWVGTSGDERKDLKVLTVLHGKFDRDKVFKGIEVASKKDENFSLIKDGDTTMFQYKPPARGEGREPPSPVYGTVVDEKTIAIGTTKDLVAAAKKRSGETDAKPQLSARLAGMVKKMDAKSSLFAVSLVKGKFKDVKLPAAGVIDLSALQKSLPDTDTISIVVNITANVDLQVVFGMKDEDAASDMGDAVAKLVDNLKALVPILAAADERAKPLVDVMKTVKSDVKNKTVTLSGMVSGDNIAKMLRPGE